MAKTVLAIAHSPETLLVIQEALRDRSRVWAYNSLQAALKVVEEGIQPQLLIAPVVLEPDSGIPFTESLINSSLKHIPMIIFATKDEQKQYAAALGKAQGILTYPFNSTQLRMAFEHLYPQRRF
jgi:CheY-like chemotaxis protein